MSTYKHLLVISDGEILENSLYTTDRARAERVIQMIQDDEIGDGGLSDEIDEVMQEAETEAAQTGDPQDETPSSEWAPEDYLDALKDFLSGRDIDLYLDELTACTPDAIEEVEAK